MHLKLILLTLLSLGSYCAKGQALIKVKLHDSVVDNSIQEILDFENLFVKQLDFEGSALENKSYVITLDEFSRGQKVRSTTLFDGLEDNIFKVKGGKTSLKFFLKVAERRLKVSIRGSFFASKKMYFQLKMGADFYTVKDLFANKEELFIPSDKASPIFAIITPSLRPDGSGTYCDVVQSGIKPEKWYEQFKVPHYFVISIQFN